MTTKAHAAVIKALSAPMEAPSRFQIGDPVIFNPNVIEDWQDEVVGPRAMVVGVTLTAGKVLYDLAFLTLLSADTWAYYDSLPVRNVDSTFVHPAKRLENEFQFITEPYVRPITAGRIKDLYLTRQELEEDSSIMAIVKASELRAAVSKDTLVYEGEIVVKVAVASAKSSDEAEKEFRNFFGEKFKNNFSVRKVQRMANGPKEKLSKTASDGLMAGKVVVLGEP